MNTKLIREKTRTWISGLSPVQMEEQGKKAGEFDWTAQIRGLTALLQHRGETVTFPDVLARSGDAFHFSHATKWELRTAHAMPIDPLLKAASNYGYKASWTSPEWTPRLIQLTMEQRLERSSKFLERLWDEINAGRPLLFGGAHGLCASWRILAGYDLENEMVCLSGGKQDTEWTPLWDEKALGLGFWDMQVRGAIRGDQFLGGWQANACFLLGPKEKDLSEPEATLNTLQLAVGLSTAPAQHTDWYGGVTYHFGQDALRQWADDLGQLNYPDDLNLPRPDNPDIYNLDLMQVQVDQIYQGRSAAADFCESAAQLLVSQDLQHAAEAYRRQSSTACNALEMFWNGDLEAQQTWWNNPIQRTSGAKAVRAILTDEQQAIQFIQKALADLIPRKETK